MAGGPFGAMNGSRGSRPNVLNSSVGRVVKNDDALCTIHLRAW